MKIIEIYKLGKLIPINYKLNKVNERLKFVQFPYTSSDILNTCVMIFFGFVLLSAITLSISSFFVYMFFFLELSLQ
jgi:hypothetical protein